MVIVAGRIMKQAAAGARGAAMTQAAERTEVLVVGAGQGGIAMSEHLSRAGIAHLVLERGRVAERWRSGRWDSLVANGPAWHDRFPGMGFPRSGPDEFPPKEEVADYLDAYARRIGAPIRTGVAVQGVARRQGAAGFLVQTSAGMVEAGFVVAATGPFQVPLIPPLLPPGAGPAQLHSAQYRNPGQIAPGAVLVVGAGSSGVQIADELHRAGRRVLLSVGPHARLPRAYRGRDYVWWLGVLNKWDMEAPPDARHATIAVSGARGGETVDFRRLAARGIELLGSTLAWEADPAGGPGRMRLAPDLAANLGAGDRAYIAILDEADAWVARNGADLPPDPEARTIPPGPEGLQTPVLALDLGAAEVGTILWATGYGADYRWLPAGATDAQGRPRHARGVGAEPGIYFLGLPWQTRWGSSFIWGVWYDARYVCDHIEKQIGYRAYRPGRWGPIRP